MEFRCVYLSTGSLTTESTAQINLYATVVQVRNIIHSIAGPPDSVQVFSCTVSQLFFFFFYEGEWITSVWALNKAACSKTDVVCCTLAERMSSLFTVEPGANFF